MEKSAPGSQFFGSESIGRILLTIAPPVMLAQLIQALYNIVDSLFVASWAESGLTALSIIYPAQLLMIALAVGTGVGVNTAMAASSGAGDEKEAGLFAGIATPLAAGLWVLFAAAGWMLMPLYARSCTSSPEVISGVVVYGRIVCALSLPLFLESMWSKILQARGDMKTPMMAQILGAAVNIALDPLLIFGFWGFPAMGIAGAAAATVAGQAAAALLVMKKAFRPSPPWKEYPGHIA
ncbi:MAG: MATE family efflux transporter, partial [Desulfovibrio sp.]